MSQTTPTIETPPTDRDLTEAEKDVLLDTYRKANAKFATELGEVQRKFDVLLGLFHRQKAIDEQSTAARPHEQRAIDAEFAVICPPPPTRRAEP